MNCRRFRDQLDEYLDCALSARQAASFRRHRADCTDCDRALQRHEAFRGTLQQALSAATADVALSSADRREILTAVEARLANRSRWRDAWERLALNPRLAFAPAALALIVLVVAVQLRDVPRETAASGNTVSYAVDVPFETEVHVFELQNGAVVDAVVTQVASSEASYSDSP